MLTGSDKVLRKTIEKILQSRLRVKPEGTMFLRLLLRFYDFFYLRKDYQEYLGHLSRQIPE